MVKKVENRASWERRPPAVDQKKGRLSGDMFIANKFLLLSVTPSIGISTVRGIGRPEADLPRDGGGGHGVAISLLPQVPIAISNAVDRDIDGPRGWTAGGRPSQGRRAQKKRLHRRWKRLGGC